MDRITQPIKLNWRRNNLVFLSFIKFQLIFIASRPEFVFLSARIKNTCDNIRLTIINGTKTIINNDNKTVTIPDSNMGDELGFKNDGSMVYGKADVPSP